MDPDASFQQNYRHGTLVIWPPDDVRAAVGALRQRYDPASQAICDAHITLTQPLAREPAASDLSAIERAVAGHPPLEIRYGPLATFLPYPCIYLQIEPADRLRALRADLHDLGLFDLNLPFSDPAEFVFHMSITDGYPDAAQTSLIYDALHGSEPTGSFTADAIAWIRPDERFHFAVCRSFHLGSRARRAGHVSLPNH